MSLALISGLGLLALTEAHAADPVIYVDDASAAMQAVNGRLGRSAELRAVSVQELLSQAAAFTKGGATAIPCADDPTTNATLTAAADRLGAAIVLGLASQRGEVAEASPGLLACLSEPVDPAEASRMLLASGAVLQMNEDERVAERLMVLARGFDAGVSWPEDWPESARVAFDRSEAVVIVEEPQPLERRPVDGVMSIDGQDVAEPVPELVPGLHLVQWGEPTRSTVIDLSGPGTVVLPSALDPAALLASPGADLGSVIDSALGNPTRAYLVDGETVLVGTMTDASGTRMWSWADLATTPPEVIDPGRPGGDGFPVGIVVASIGGAAMVFGGAFAIVNDNVARKKAEDDRANPGQGLRCDCHDAIKRRTAGQVIALSGAVVLAGGLAIQFMQPTARGSAPVTVGVGGTF